MCKPRDLYQSFGDEFWEEEEEIIRKRQWEGFFNDLLIAIDPYGEFREAEKVAFDLVEEEPSEEDLEREVRLSEEEREEWRQRAAEREKRSRPN